jgi:hypothetical protein
MLDDRGSSNSSLVILPFSLQPGEAALVGNRLLAVFQAASRVAREGARTLQPPAVDIKGSWQVRVEYRNAQSMHTIVIDGDARDVIGTHRTAYSEQPLRGVITGRNVDLTSLHPYEGTSLAFRFNGIIDAQGETINGSVELGTTGQAAPGPLNMKEFGSAVWHARRQSA